MIKTLLTVAALATLPMAAQATTIDFDTDGGVASFSATNVLDTYTVADRVFTFSQYTMSGQASSGANLFESATCAPDFTGTVVASCDGNDDGDLVADQPNTDGVGGNVLIRQQASATLDDDAAGNGAIFMTLTSGGDFTLDSFAGIDASQYAVALNGTVLVDGLNGSGNRMTDTFTFAPIRVTRGDTIAFILAGSGGVDAVTISPIPLPAGAVLLLGALGGLGVMRRRANRAA